MRLRKQFLVRIVIARIVSVKLKRRKFKSCDDIECLVFWLKVIFFSALVVPLQHAALQSMNIQNADTSRSDSEFRDERQNLEISTKIKIYSKCILKTFPDIQQPAFYNVIESPPRILLLRRATILFQQKVDGQFSWNQF